jgi:hypothetical protein
VRGGHPLRFFRSCEERKSREQSKCKLATFLKMLDALENIQLRAEVRKLAGLIEKGANYRVSDICEWNCWSNFRRIWRSGRVFDPTTDQSIQNADIEKGLARRPVVSAF